MKLMVLKLAIILLKKIKMKIFQLIFTLCLVLSLSLNMKGQSQDLSLSEAIELALNNNYGILISEVDIQAAEITNTRGNAGGLPSIGFDASSQNSVRYSDGNNTKINNLSANLGMSWKIFDGFRVKFNLEKLQTLEDLSKGQSAVVIENTIQDVVLNYYYILLLQENLKVLDEIMQLSKDRYDYEQSRFELGGTVSIYVLLAKNNWLNDQSDFLSQEIRLKEAERSFNFLLAEKDNPKWELSEKFIYEKKDFVLDELITKMLSNNQVLKNQYLNQSLKEKERKIKESDLLPELSLSAGVANTFIMNSSQSAVNTFYPYGNVSFSYDIFTGGIRNTAIKIAELNESVSQIQSEEMIHSMTNFILGVYDNYLLKNELLSIAEESLEIASRNLEIADEKYKNGSITSFEYRDIQLIYLNASQRRLSAIYDLKETDTELTRLTGGFISPE
jgi:outer membrane protein